MTLTPSDIGEGILLMAPSAIVPEVVILDSKVTSLAHKLAYNV